MWRDGTRHALGDGKKSGVGERGRGKRQTYRGEGVRLIDGDAPAAKSDGRLKDRRLRVAVVDGGRADSDPHLGVAEETVCDRLEGEGGTWDNGQGVCLWRCTYGAGSAMLRVWEGVAMLHILSHERRSTMAAADAVRLNSVKPKSNLVAESMRSLNFCLVSSLP